MLPLQTSYSRTMHSILWCVFHLQNTRQHPSLNPTFRMEWRETAALKTRRFCVPSNKHSSMASKALLLPTVPSSAQSPFHPLLSCAQLCVISKSDSQFSSVSPYLAQIEHCLREWQSGKRVPANLDEATDGLRYRTHMANAVSWQGLNRTATTRIREHLSKKLLWVPTNMLKGRADIPLQ